MITQTKKNIKKLSQSVLNVVTQITSKEADIRIPISVHKKYIIYHNKIDCEKYDYKKVIEQSKRSLFDQGTDGVIKKKLLFLLGYFATKECFDLLMLYINDPQCNLKEWAILAIKDLQLSIESEIYNEDQTTIMSPMGGKANMVRYFVVIGSKHNKILSADTKKIITKDLIAITTNKYSQVEKIEFGKNYVFFTILISFDIASQKVIDTFLNKISKEKDILKYHFSIVNTHKITKKEIDKYLQMKEIKKL